MKRMASARPGRGSFTGNRSKRSAWGTASAGRSAIQAERRRDRRLSEKRNVRLDDPNPAELREFIKSQICWWCGAGPFKALSMHVSFARHISAFDFRNYGGVLRSDSWIDRDYHDARSERSRNEDSVKRIQGMGHKGTKNHMTEAGKAISKAKLMRVRETHDMVAIQQMATLASAAKYSKPIPCTYCGKPMPRSMPKTCSPECRLEVRRVTVKVSHAKVRASGVMRRPHPCPVCRIIIPTSMPKHCSPKCSRKGSANQRAHKPCTTCGRDTGRYDRMTCSPECLAEARRRNGLAWKAGQLR